MADKHDSSKTQAAVAMKPGLALPVVATGDARTGPVPESGPSETGEITAAGSDPAARRVPAAKPASGGTAEQTAAAKTVTGQRTGAPQKARPSTPRKAERPKAKRRTAAASKGKTAQRPKRAKRPEPERPAAAAPTRAPDAAAFGEETLAACAESGARAAKGLETLSKEMLSFGRNTVEANLAQTQALLAAHSLGEAFALQRDFAGAQISALVDEAAKLSRLGATAAQEAFAPLASRAGAFTRRVDRSKAA